MNIAVSPTKVIFTAHRSSLLDVFEFFTNALSGEFREAQTATITFADTSVDTFNTFIEWLYTRRLFDGVEPCPEHPDHQTRKKHQATLLDLYIFADKYDIPQMRNDIFDRFARCVTHWTNTYTMNLDIILKAYENLPAECPIVRFCIDQLAFRPNDLPNSILDRLALFPSRMLSLTLREVWIKHKPIACRYDDDPCSFHEHSSEEEKAGCTRK